MNREVSPCINSGQHECSSQHECNSVELPSDTHISAFLVKGYYIHTWPSRGSGSDTYHRSEVAGDVPDAQP